MTVFSLLLAFANASVSSGCAVALALICLLQYITQVHRVNHMRREIDLAREQYESVARELQGLAGELNDARRDRALTRFEAQVLRDFMSQDDCDKALRAFLRRFVPNPDDAFAAFLRHDAGRMIVTQSHGLADAPAAALQIEGGLLTRLVRGEAITLSRQEVRDSRVWESLSPAERNKIRQLHFFGIASAGELSGVLMTTALAPPGLRPAEQIELAARLLSSITVSLRQKMLLEAQQGQLRSTEEMLALREVVDRSYDSPAHMLEEFLRQAAGKSAADRAALYLCTADATAPLKAFVRCGEALKPGQKEQWQRYEDELAQLSQTLRAVRQYGAHDLERMRIVTMIGSALVVPVLQQSRPLGLICFSRRARQPFTEAHESLAAWSGSLLADLIPRTVNQVVVERQARLDGLTQLANRGEFERQLPQLIQAARQNGTPLSLLMFDLDRFKSINDTYGHRGGDAVLRAAADVIRQCVRGIRSTDQADGVRPFLARYGGEELAVVLQLDADAARRIGEFIRMRLEMQAIGFEGHCIRVTTSAGLAAFRDHGGSPAELVAAADAALYQAKAQGRNRLETALTFGVLV